MPLIPTILIATIAGSLLAPFYSIDAHFGGLLLGCCLLVMLCCRRCRYPLLLVVLLFFLLLANLRYARQFPADSVIDRVDEVASKLAVTAELLNIAQRTGQKSQLDLRLIALRQGDEQIALPSVLLVRLYLGDQGRGLLPGDRLSFTTRLRKPRMFGTPGEFNWPRYLASQNIALTGWLKSSEQLSVIGRGTSTLRGLTAWKQRAALAIDGAVAGPSALLVRALILGEARLLPDAIRDQLAQAGISHLFAISGLHLGLLGVLGYRVLLFFYRRSTRLLLWQPPQRILPLLLLPLLLIYLLLTGDAVSTRRAFCVALFAAVFWLWRYSVNPLRLLMFLALLFLLFNPLLLWQPGWQLSFAGAAGILLWRPLWQDRTATLPRWLRAPTSLLLVSIAATLATLPLVLASFHQLAPAGIVANLLAVPLVALLALPSGLCGLLLLGLPPLSNLCFYFCGLLLQGTVYCIDWLLAVPGFSGQFLFLTRWQYLAVGLLVLPLILIAQPAINQGWRRFAAICLALALLCGFSPPTGPVDQELVMFSVGQGESLLLTNAAQQAVLVDGGGLYSKRFDVGQRLLAPALGELGIRHLTAVLLTHDHPDHRKGLVFILKHIPVDEFWSGVPLVDLHPQLQAVLREKEIPLRVFAEGWSKVEPWSQAKMHLYRTPQQANKNDSSLVLYLQTQAGGLLLTGDLEKKGVATLLDTGLPGPVSMLKLPHHGSRHSDTERLFALLQPDFCLVSAGRNNRYGFPARQLVDQLREQQVPLHRTDTMGTVRVRSVVGQWQVDHWRDGLFR